MFTIFAGIVVGCLVWGWIASPSRSEREQIEAERVRQNAEVERRIQDFYRK